MANEPTPAAFLDESLTPEAVSDPYTFLGTVRESDPIHWNARYRSWVLTRHADVGAAMSDQRFSSDRISPVIARERRKERPNLGLVETLELLNGWLVFRAQPELTRFRRLVHKEFPPRIIPAMPPEDRSKASRVGKKCVS